jgi:hypothetical protein
MTAAVFLASAGPPAWCGAPQPVDADFLDYLATVEGKDDNWTVVASERERKKVAARQPPAKNPPDKPDAPAKPPEVKP